MKGLRYLLEALAKLRTERPELHLTVIGRQKEGGRSAETIDHLGLADAVEFVSGVTDQRLVELYNEAELAVVPSLYEGFSLPAIEAMSCGSPVVATTGGAIPEVVGTDGETALLVPPGDSEALAARIAWALDHPTSGPPSAPPGGSGWIAVELAAHRRAHRRAVPGPAGRGPLSDADRHRRAEPRTRVEACGADRRLRRAGPGPGPLVLDMGAGAGRHAFEAFRRGARVVALDYGFDELGDVRTLFAAMRTRARRRQPRRRGQRRRHPPAVPRRHLRPHHLLGGLRAHPGPGRRLRELRRVLKPGGVLAATVPAWLPEKVCWALSEEYHAPFVEGGHVRIYTEAGLRQDLRDAGLRPGDATTPTPCTRRTGGSSARWGRPTTTTPW